MLFLRGGEQFSPRYFDDRELAYLAKYIIKRVAMGLLCIFIVATLTFLLMNLVPGGPFTAEKSMSEAAQRALEAKFGLDKPLGQRYLTYMSDLLKGDMGPSLKQRGRSVNEIISSKFRFRRVLRALPCSYRCSSVSRWAVSRPITEENSPIILLSCLRPAE